MNALEILSTPVTDAQFSEQALLIEKGKQEAKWKDRRVVKDLSSRGLPVPTIQSILSEIDRAYVGQEWSIVTRLCCDLIHQGVDWIPTLFARASLSCCFTSNQDTVLSYANKSMKFFPEQAPAYLAMAFCKKSVGRSREALAWLQLAKLALNNNEPLWKAVNAELSWGVHIGTDHNCH